MSKRAYVAVLATSIGLAAIVVGACSGDLPKPPMAALSPGLPPDASLPPRVIETDAGTEVDRVEAEFVKGQTRITAPPCSRVFIAVAEGKATTGRDVLERGDVMIVKYPDAPMYVNVEGLALHVMQPFSCTLFDKPGPEVSFRRAAQAPQLTWANARMHAHLDVGKDVSPDLYLGRLEGTVGVPDHKHDTAIEILAAVEASGTFTLAGQTTRVGPRQIVRVPANTVHSWTPDPGERLVAWQMYLPPGPEQRFVALDAAEKDAGPKK